MDLYLKGRQVFQEDPPLRRKVSDRNWRPSRLGRMWQSEGSKFFVGFKNVSFTADELRRIADFMDASTPLAADGSVVG